MLETGAIRPVVQRTTGLYHVAIHVPKRTDLAQFAVRALQRDVRISPTDHLVSEAIYLWDLDGNGIEITFETPWRGTLGDPESGVLRHDHRWQAAFRPRADRPRGPARRTRAQTRCSRRACRPARASATSTCTSTTSTQSMAFYRDGIGFGGLFIIKSFGMGDVGLDYTPHTIAFNIWAGPNATQAPAGSAGLRWFTIVVPDETTLDDVRARLTRHHYEFAEIGGGIEARDPSGNLVKVVTALEVDRLGAGERRRDVDRHLLGARAAAPRSRPLP